MELEGGEDKLKKTDKSPESLSNSIEAEEQNNKNVVDEDLDLLSEESSKKGDKRSDDRRKERSEDRKREYRNDRQRERTEDRF
jgi:hypothetical protein